MEKFRAVIAATDDQSHTPTGIKIQGIRIDCSALEDTSGNSNFAGIYVANTQDIDLVNCDVIGCHDQAWFASAGGKELEVAIDGGSFNDAWPLANNQGHAGMWVRGAGKITVTVHDAEFSGSHDAVEIAGEVGTTVGDVTFEMVDCQVMNNENGLEIVGGGMLDLTVTGSLFWRNYNRFADGGTPAPGEFPSDPSKEVSVAAVVLRGMIMRTDIFRNNTFMNNAQGVLWSVPQTLAPLDLGMDGSPGLNKFCMDFADVQGKGLLPRHVGRWDQQPDDNLRGRQLVEAAESGSHARGVPDESRTGSPRLRPPEHVER